MTMSPGENYSFSPSAWQALPWALWPTVLIVRSVTGSISRMLDLIQEIANKNLTIEDMKITSEDEIGKAGLAINQMKNSLHEVIQSIAETAQHVASASEELSAT